MHLGQAADFYAEVLGLEQPTTRVFSRLMRQAGYVQKGGRGRSARHISDLEHARFMISLMAAESPSVAVERLPHFASLPLSASFRDGGIYEADSTGKITFEIALARLIKTIRDMDWNEGRKWNWSVELRTATSTAIIGTERRIDDEGIDERHIFDPFPGNEVPDGSEPIFPYYSGLQRTSTIPFLPLFRVAHGLKADAEILATVGIEEQVT